MSPFMLKLLGRIYMSEEGGGEGGAPAGGAADAPASTAPVGEAAPSVLDAPTLLTDTPAVTEGDKPAEVKEGEEAKPAEQQGAPEAYEAFKLPEGIQGDEGLMTEFSSLAKELNLSQEAAQKLVDLQTKLVQGDDGAHRKMMEAALTKQREVWADQVKNDPQLGGDKFDASRTVAAKAMQAYASDGLRSLLNESGIGNHPEMFKLFHAIGTKLSEDSLVMPGATSSTKDPQRPADRLFGHFNEK